MPRVNTIFRSNYAEGRSEDEVSPWIEAFVNARKWIEEKVKA